MAITIRGNREALSSILRYFKTVKLAPVRAPNLARIQLYRNNRHYEFVLQVCRFVLESMLPDEAGTGFAFRDFTRNDKAMAKLFEEFVRNFYLQHAQE